MISFYVYAYIRSSDSITAKSGTPYYIGKGSGDRAYRKHVGVSLPKDNTKIVFLETNLTNFGSLCLERRMIKWYGRKDLGTGILHNKTDGGEGSPGAIFSEEHKNKLSIALTGRIFSDETKEKMSIAQKGKMHSPEHMQRMSNINRGNSRSKEVKLKISKSHMGKKQGPHTQDHKDKISNALAGRSKSEDTKNKMRIAQQLRRSLTH